MSESAIFQREEEMWGMELDYKFVVPIVVFSTFEIE